MFEVVNVASSQGVAGHCFEEKCSHCRQYQHSAGRHVEYVLPPLDEIAQDIVDVFAALCFQ